MDTKRYLGVVFWEKTNAWNHVLNFLANCFVCWIFLIDIYLLLNQIQKSLFRKVDYRGKNMIWHLTTVFLEIPHLPLDLEQILHLISLFYLNFFVKNYLVLFWAAMTLSLGDMIFLILVGTGNSDRELIFPNSAGLLLSINCFRLDNSSKSVISLALVTKFWVLQDLGKVLYNLPPSKTFGSNSTTLKILYRLLIFFRTIKTNNAWNYLKMTLTAILEYFLRNPRVTSCKVTSAKCSF